jgi:hypothetical protein
VHRIKDGKITADVSDLYGSSSSTPSAPQATTSVTVSEVKKEPVVSKPVQDKVEEIVKCPNSSCKCPDCTCGIGCTCGISPEVSCDPCNDFKAVMVAKKAAEANAAETKAAEIKVVEDKVSSKVEETNVESKPVPDKTVVEPVIKSVAEPVVEKSVPSTPPKQGMFSKFTSMFSPSAKGPAPVSVKTYPPITRTYTIEELTTGKIGCILLTYYYYYNYCYFFLYFRYVRCRC